MPHPRTDPASPPTPTPATVVGPAEVAERTAAVRAAKEARVRLGRSPDVLPAAVLDAALPPGPGTYQARRRRERRAARAARGLPEAAELGELRPVPRAGPVRICRVPNVLRGLVEEE